MGAACCVAAKNKTATSGSPVEALHRHDRYSPTWNFRWDNRRRVAGEETSVNWLRDRGYGVDYVEVKSATAVETAFASEASPLSEASGRTSRLPSPDQVLSQNIVEVKESTGSPSPIRVSPSVPSVSSVSASPLSSHSYLLPLNSTPRRLHHHSPGQVSDNVVPGYKSPSTWGNDLTRVSNCGSSDSWSIASLSELILIQKERWSIDSEMSGFGRERVTVLSARHSGSSSLDLQPCGICTKLVTERSLWRSNSQKIISTSEIAVVSVLPCGHVYHAECLEYMTPELNKYDPTCPVCTLGSKRTVKMAEQAMKAEMDSKARKRSRKRVIDSDLASSTFDHLKSWDEEEFHHKMSSNSSTKRKSLGKSFLRHHFSLGSRTSKSMSENASTSRKGFFWTRSSKD